MRERFIGSIVVLVTVLAFSSVMPAQTAPQSRTPKVQTAAPARAHDLSGVWLIKQEYLDSARLGVYGAPMRGVPPMTAWARARYAGAKPGSVAGTGAEDNDPALHCDPPGMPRIIGAGPFEIIQIPGRILILFEDFYTRRTIWTDGRDLPKDPDPTWYGYSVGRWEGDTLVVDTVGFDDRSWLNGGGYPHSDAMHVVERFRRPDHDTLELSMTIDDPKAYTKPWVSNAPRVFKLKPKYELLEAPCVPEDEESFLKSVREPAATKSNK
jgi:hypothetical protein